MDEQHFWHVMDTPKTLAPLHIRWMIRRDMPEVLDIENQSYVGSFVWSQDDFISCLCQRNCIGMVAEFEEQVVGFMIYELHKTRLHVLNFAVHPAFRYRGVGRSMMDKLKNKVTTARRTEITLQVRETNLAGLQFFKASGFRAVSVLRDFYDDATEDAIDMRYRVLARINERREER